MNTRKINFKSIITIIMFLVIILFSLKSCGGSAIDELNRMIKIALRDDNTIDETEWNEFIEYEIDSEKLTSLISSIAKKRRGKEEPKIFSPVIEKEAVTAKIKVFIENSGSMDGYVNGITEFEAALSNLLVDLQYKYSKENLDINFINTKIYPSQVEELKEFAGTLEPSKKPYKVGNRSSSKLNEILEMILDSTDQNSISILTSDCIYSLEKGKDTEGALEFEKSLTKGAFLQKSREFNFSTIVLKMNSKFDGTYYDKNNKKTQLSNIERPYYFWIIGQDEILEKFQKNINMKELKGFKNSYFLSNSQENKQPYFTLLTKTNNKGTFKKTDKSSKVIRSINSIKYNIDGVFQFAIAIDLSHVPVDKSYLINPKNYSADGFIVESIKTVDISAISDKDFHTIENTTATHIITISTSKDITSRDLNLELSNKIPFWVEDSHSNDDSDIKNQLNKTFGLLYLVIGVSEAYKRIDADNESYININVKI